MATGKKSFILYCDLLDSVEHLTNEELGGLFRHVLQYVNDLNPVLEDRLLQTAWKPIQRVLKADLVKYESTTERNRVNGAKGGRPPKPKETDENPKKPTGLNGNPKKGDSDSDSDTVSDNEIKKSKGKPKISFSHPLAIWVSSLPAVSKMKNPLADEQAVKLLEDYSREGIQEIFEAMDNYTPLLKKNNSAYLTFVGWVKVRRKANPNFGSKTKGIVPTIIDAN